MASGLKRLKGDLYLGYRAVIAHPLRKLFRQDSRTGKQRFLDNYGSEGLLPMTLEDREVLAGASRCIHCGLCDAHELTRAALPRAQYDGVSVLPVSYARSTTELPHTSPVFEALREEDLARAEAVCPTRVPLRSILRYLRRKDEGLKELAPDWRDPEEGAK